MTPYQPLPTPAMELCRRVDAPPRLVAHLVLVHDAAHSLLRNLHTAFPNLKVSDDEVLFGAATHDLGKILHPGELSGPGKLHEASGLQLLSDLGVPAEKARFASSHGSWNEPVPIPLEDLLVALADNCWKGKRLEDVESKVVERISSASDLPAWEVFGCLDTILEEIASKADARLAWQFQFPAP